MLRVRPDRLKAHQYWRGFKAASEYGSSFTFVSYGLTSLNRPVRWYRICFKCRITAEKYQ